MLAIHNCCSLVTYSFWTPVNVNYRKIKEKTQQNPPQKTKPNKQKNQKQKQTTKKQLNKLSITKKIYKNETNKA